ncbi:hypothetical protein V8E53_006876, partial [Lactarius tabidus]
KLVWIGMHGSFVPSLLKWWNRLEASFDASAQAYKALSKHFKNNTKEWLREDKYAQANRQSSLSAVDIYDTVQDKAPSRATIQQELMVEEIGDHSVQGQTSWLSSGLKIQETKLGIRYQLWSQGPQLTTEDSQILENKRAHLQKAIDIFSHQSDAFIIHHEFSEDVSLLAMSDYSEYDNADNMYESRVLGHSDRAHRSHHTEGSGANAEDFTLTLPSSLGWEWCIQKGNKALANKEARLRFAQATDAIHKICLVLGFKSTLFRTQVRHSRTQKTKSRAWTAIRSIDTSVHEHARNYSMARDAYIKVFDPSRGFPELLPLQLADLSVKTVILGAVELGQRNQQCPWIWSFGTSTKKDGEWMDDFNRVHWLRAKAQFERWKEEQDSIHNKALWVPAYFHANAEL